MKTTVAKDTLVSKSDLRDLGADLKVSMYKLATLQALTIIGVLGSLFVALVKL